MKRRDFITKAGVGTAVGLGAVALLSGCDEADKEKKVLKTPAVQQSKKTITIVLLLLPHASWRDTRCARDQSVY